MNLPKDILILDHGNKHHGMAICKKIASYQLIDLIQGFTFNKMIVDFCHAIAVNEEIFWGNILLASNLFKRINLDNVNDAYNNCKKCPSKETFISSMKNIFDVSEHEIIVGFAPLLFNCDEIPKGYLPVGLMALGLLRDGELQKHLTPHYFMEIIPSQRGHSYMDMIRDAWGEKYGYENMIYEANIMNTNFLLKKGYKLAREFGPDELKIQQTYHYAKSNIIGSKFSADEVLKIVTIDTHQLCYK